MHTFVETTPDLARRMFRRTLSAWAGDCLRLRRLGLDRPSARGLWEGGEGSVAPVPQAVLAGLAHVPPGDAQEPPA